MLITGEEIRAKRQACGLSQRQLAEEIGAVPRLIARWEIGGLIPCPSLSRALRDLFESRLEQDELAGRWRGGAS